MYAGEDIHLKTWIFDRAEDILKDGKADRAVCLMDIPDDWGMEFRVESYREYLIMFSSHMVVLQRILYAG